ncbi:hypothetical protein [Paenibacillus durus]|uniref:hypothetical protein n=1 Tax=Paenibacillus durus TaxID=44251 RepID=UPI0012E09CFB|nr:hypothetical protein [Paenibacillus durus]
MDEQSDEALQEFWFDLWGSNSYKLKYTLKNEGRTDSSIYYAEYGTYNFKHYDWEGCMYRMFEELSPSHFNQFHVEPKIKAYLDQLGYEDDDRKVLNHLSFWANSPQGYFAFSLFFWSNASLPISLDSNQQKRHPSRSMSLS